MSCFQCEELRSLLVIFAAGFLGEYAEAQDVGTTVSRLEHGPVVPASEIERTGAIHFYFLSEVGPSGCSGMLITPSWVITAAHCEGAPGNKVTFGRTNDPEARSAIIDMSVAHSQYDWVHHGPEYDVRLMRLATPLFPRLDSGRVWAWYRRDIYRNSVHALENDIVDIYGYGIPACPTYNLLVLLFIQSDPIQLPLV